MPVSPSLIGMVGTQNKDIGKDFAQGLRDDAVLREDKRRFEIETEMAGLKQKQEAGQKKLANRLSVLSNIIAHGDTVSANEALMEQALLTGLDADGMKENLEEIQQLHKTIGKFNKEGKTEEARQTFEYLKKKYPKRADEDLEKKITTAEDVGAGHYSFKEKARADAGVAVGGKSLAQLTAEKEIDTDAQKEVAKFKHGLKVDDPTSLDAVSKRAEWIIDNGIETDPAKAFQLANKTDKASWVNSVVKALFVSAGIAGVNVEPEEVLRVAEEAENYWDNTYITPVDKKKIEAPVGSAPDAIPTSPSRERSAVSRGVMPKDEELVTTPRQDAAIAQKIKRYRDKGFSDDVIREVLQLDASRHGIKLNLSDYGL